MHEIETYQQIQQFILFAGISKRNFDADFPQNYYAMTGYYLKNLYLVNPVLNATRSPSDTYFGICMSEWYIIVTRNDNGTESMFSNAPVDL